MRIEAALVVVAMLTTLTPSQRSTASATRNGVIVGRVVDSLNQPVSDVLVVPLWETPSRHGKTIHLFDVRGGSTTNANGEFRVERLFAGSYYLAALPQNVPRGLPLPINSDEHRFGYAITFYPGATRLAQAKPLVVTEKSPAKGNILLASAHLARISGIAIKSDGQPASGGRLSVAHGDHLFGVDSIAVPIRQDGSFVIVGVPPGTYHLHLREGQWPPPRDVIPKVSVAKVIVSDGDVTRVRVLPIEMVKATGRLILNTSQRALLASGITISGVPVDADGNPGPT